MLSLLPILIKGLESGHSPDNTSSKVAKILSHKSSTDRCFSAVNGSIRQRECKQNLVAF